MAGAGQHLITPNAPKGNAADVHIDGFTNRQTAEALRDTGQFNRVNYYTNRPGATDAHVDMKKSGNQGFFINWCHQPKPGKC